MTALTQNDFQPGTVYTTRHGCGNGRAVQTFKVVQAPYFSEGYERVMLTARRWIKKTEKFSGTAYVYSLDGILEDGQIVQSPEA